MKLHIVDAEKIRNTIDTDFSGAATHEDFPWIPKGELWLDKHFKKEHKLFVALEALERKLKSRPFKEVRAAAQKQFIQEGSSVAVLKTMKKSGYVIRIVDGASVRKAVDPFFMLGGHDLVYSYLPKNEIWIDSCQSKQEQIYTLEHELKERELMRKGMSYYDAHDYAIAYERSLRRRDGVADFLRG